MLMWAVFHTRWQLAQDQPADTTTVMLQCSFCRMRVVVNATDVIVWPPDSSPPAQEPVTGAAGVTQTLPGAAAASPETAHSASSGAALSPSPSKAPRTKQEAAAAIGSTSRFGQVVRFRRHPSGSELDGQRAAKRPHSATTKFEPHANHRVSCPFADDGYKQLISGPTVEKPPSFGMTPRPDGAGVISPQRQLAARLLLQKLRG